VVEHLPRRHKALGSSPDYTKIKITHREHKGDGTVSQLPQRCEKLRTLFHGCVLIRTKAVSVSQKV
jgi:hypothetical protein